MAAVEVSRTLVKSAPELWKELEGERLKQAVGDVTVASTEPERALRWEGAGMSGTARLEPAGWGTRVVLTAEFEEAVAERARWWRIGRQPAPPPKGPEVERRLTELLDALGAAHRKPFSRE